jgi:hypothetical protein
MEKKKKKKTFETHNSTTNTNQTNKNPNNNNVEEEEEEELTWEDYQHHCCYSFSRLVYLGDNLNALNDGDSKVKSEC